MTLLVNEAMVDIGLGTAGLVALLGYLVVFFGLVLMVLGIIGEYLGKIASKYHVSVAKIKKWNNLKNDNIRAGQNLVIYRGGSGPTTSESSSAGSSTAKSTSTPKASSSSSAKGHSTYTVKSGDSFYSIAKNYPGVSAQNIMDYNGINSSKLKPGMVIKIPQY